MGGGTGERGSGTREKVECLSTGRKLRVIIARLECALELSSVEPIIQYSMIRAGAGDTVDIVGIERGDKIQDMKHQRIRSAKCNNCLCERDVYKTRLP